MGKNLIIRGANFSENSLGISDAFMQVDLEDYPLVAGYINSATMKWSVNNGEVPNYYHIEIPISDLDNAEAITINAVIDTTTPRWNKRILQDISSVHLVRVAFFSAALPNPIVDGNDVENLLGNISVDKDTTKRIPIPSGTACIYLYIGYLNEWGITPYIPSKFVAE